MWNGAELDLDGYLTRIGYEGDLAPTPENLRALHSAHVRSLPFENLDVILGRGVPLSLSALQDKLLRSGRGGYCYEHVTLYAAALERFGFAFSGLAARVRMGTDALRPATHAILLVRTGRTATSTVAAATATATAATATPTAAPTAAPAGHAQEDGEEALWLCDVGFGSSPLIPLALRDGAEGASGDWRYRLEQHTVTPGADGWLLYVWDAAEGCWFDRHGFTLTPQYPVDYEVGNHFVGTHPSSPFTTRPYVQRVLPDRLHVLDGLRLTTHRPGDGSAETASLEPTEVRDALRDVFGIVLTDDDARELLPQLLRLQPL